MRDLLTEEECRELVAQQYVPEGVLFSQAMRLMLQRAARLGAERAMQAPDGDLPAMLEQLPRLRDWYAIGEAQRAEVDTLVAWVRDLALYGKRRGEEG